MSKNEQQSLIPVADSGISWVPKVGEQYIAASNMEQLTFDDTIAIAAEYLDDWPLTDKVNLVAVPFVILGVNAFEGMGQDGRVFNIRCVNQENEHFSFNDGSSGVYEQLKQILEKIGEARPILVKGGLRVSKYYWDQEQQMVVDAPGPHITPAATYYLSSSVEASKKSLVK